MSEMIQTYEHRSFPMQEEDLLGLLKAVPCKLVDDVDLRKGICSTGYFVGLDRICGEKHILYVAPKFEEYDKQTNYLRMLSGCLRHPEVLGHTDELFSIDLESEPISIDQAKDLITPLVIVQFLRCVSRIVKKGLQKGYYTVEENMRSAVKGKILVSRTIQRNHLNEKMFHTWCSRQEFGFDNTQNRVLKKTLQFIERYNHSSLDLKPVLHYTLPAFGQIGAEFKPREIDRIKFNPFFSEYKEAIGLARIILKRFGFNINAVSDKAKTTVPPFWIDMAKLFELYVLGKLKDALPPGEIVFQANGEFGYLDFLRTTSGEELIIDAKYKGIYARGGYDIDNIRQLSAYARDTGLFKQLSILKADWEQTVLPCLVIHPDRNAGTELNTKNLLAERIPQFQSFFKVGIALPLLIE
jgi:5-methylcytosine-specific restriction enzyme subunit McrC